MKASELRQKDVTELQKLLSEELRSYFNLRMQQRIEGQGIKPSEIKKSRRGIARTKTILNEVDNKTI